MDRIIVVEAISSSVGYIKDIRDAGYEPIALENYVDFDKLKESRFIHDYYYTAFNIDKPQIILAKENYEETLEIVKQLKPVLIIPGGDDGVILATRLAADLHLPGNSVDLIIEYKNKMNQQKRLMDAGLRYIRSKVVYTVEEAVEFYRHYELKRMVVKPISGKATVGVFVIENESEIMTAVEKNIELAGIVNPGVLVQEYIEGVEYIVDSLFCQGKHRNTIRAVYDKVFVEKAAYVYDSAKILSPGTIESLENYASQVCDVLGLQYGAVHSEFKIDDKGPVLIEINLRVCGAMMTPDYQESIFGYHETQLSLGSYLFPEETYKTLSNLTKLRKSGTIKLIRISERLYVKKHLFEEVCKELKTCSYYLDMGENKYYEKTIDLSTCAGLFYLVGDAQDVDEDVAYLRNLECNNLDKLFDYEVSK